MPLSKFIKAKRDEISKLRELAEKGEFPRPFEGKRASFSGALIERRARFPVIAEFKRASPSMGDIRAEAEIEDVARQYFRAGAAALSILTEEVWFKGDFDFMRRAANVADIPILRKDFIFDPLQIEMTASSPASALLLIVRLTPNVPSLRESRERAEKLGLECVVEAFDERDLKMARDSGARIIQINSRDLGTLKVDRASAARLIRAYPPDKGEIWISASGVKTADDLREASRDGFSAALVGTTLMANGTPGEDLRKLLDGSCP